MVHGPCFTGYGCFTCYGIWLAYVRGTIWCPGSFDLVGSRSVPVKTAKVNRSKGPPLAGTSNLELSGDTITTVPRSCNTIGDISGVRPYRVSLYRVSLSERYRTKTRECEVHDEGITWVSSKLSYLQQLIGFKLAPPASMLKPV